MDRLTVHHPTFGRTWLQAVQADGENISGLYVAAAL